MTLKPLNSLRLKKGSDRRFREGHPWVFSNELSVDPSAKLAPGQEATLCAPGGEVLAQGYYNPKSLIAFRVTARGPEATFDLERALRTAWERRIQMGYAKNEAFRWVFGEGDGLPGLVVDHYGSFDVVQSHTAGSDAWIQKLGEPAFAQLLQRISGSHGVQLHQDLTHRKHEGLEMLPTRWLGHAPAVCEGTLPGGLTLRFDAKAPQKTGLFLDQIHNQRVFLDLVRRVTERPRRVLDLFCYVGQWSCALAHALGPRARETEWVLADASAPALEHARFNLSRLGVEGPSVKAVERDLIREFGDDLTGFDVVIADPPALIATRSSIPQGTHAYLQVFEKSLRSLRPGGWIVASSCSALLSDEAFRSTLAKAERRAGVAVQWVAQGGLPADHPRLAAFPEGQYLKAWVGRVDLRAEGPA